MANFTATKEQHVAHGIIEKHYIRRHMADTIARWLQGIGTFLIGLALLAAVVILPISFNKAASPRDISVTGRATRATTPNQSQISGSFEETATSSDEARNKVREKSSKAITALKATGVDEKKITTTNVSVYPQYDYSEKTQKITGYRGSTTVSITLEDTAKADGIVSALTSNGAASTDGPTLGFTEAAKTQLLNELKLEAIADAKRQAEASAKQAGTRLGKVLSISGDSLNTGEGGPIRPMAFEATDAARTTAGAAPSDIVVGERNVSVTVQVSYELR
jgi:uncharacterized protein YggE